MTISGKMKNLANSDLDTLVAVPRLILYTKWKIDITLS